MENRSARRIAAVFMMWTTFFLCGLVFGPCPVQAAQEEDYQYLVGYYQAEGATPEEAALWAETAIMNGFSLDAPETITGPSLMAGVAVQAFPFSVDDYLREGATRLGTPYLWGYKGSGMGVCGVPVGQSTTVGTRPACAVGYDCSGYVFDVLKHFGITMYNEWWQREASYLSERTTGLPLATYGWYSIARQGLSFSWGYQGQSVAQGIGDVKVYYGTAAVKTAMESGVIKRGDIIERQSSGGGHIVFYLGKFENANEVRSYVTSTLGVPESWITPQTLYDYATGDMADHYWTMEAHGYSSTKTPTTGCCVRFTNSIANTNAEPSATYCVFSIPCGTQPAPTISHVAVTGVDAGGYTVEATFSCPAGIKEVLMPTWTNNGGQDDLVWHQAEVSGNTAICRISASSHRGESGAYTTHIYVYDKAGKFALEGMTANVPGAKPVTEPKVTVSQVSTLGYTVTVETEEADGTVFLFPTWTTNNGQDDLLWKHAAVHDGKAVFEVLSADHKNESGTYITHIYREEPSGPQIITGVTKQVPAAPSRAPVILSAEVSEISAEGYTVNVSFAADTPAKVRLPTWTERQGQDDIVWHEAQVTGNTARGIIPVSAHNGESGVYITHVYVYDSQGRQALVGCRADVPTPQNTPPTILST